ncbi:MAG TPA: hypothetical protein VLN72_08585 [Gillisia sp.]|nr:hypothetical protein [Gillisia sp.]
MVYKFFKNTFLFVLITMVSCGRTTGQTENIVAENTPEVQEVKPIIVGANRLDIYLPL